MYQPGYPIHIIADEVAELEEDSKSKNGKNSLTILPDGDKHKEKNSEGNEIEINDGTYNWIEFEEEVIGEKYKTINKFFSNTEDKGKNFLYNLLELIRNRKDKINLARYVYLLSRMEPDSKSSPEGKALYKEFSKQMYEWIKDDKDCRQLKTAINLYAYLIRDKEDKQ